MTMDQFRVASLESARARKMFVLSLHHYGPLSAFNNNCHLVLQSVVIVKAILVTKGKVAGSARKVHSE